MSNNRAEAPRTTANDGTEVTPVEARQGTGPRDMFSVLVISLLLAAVAGTALLAYFLA
jgi:hypothetical protein